MTKTGWIIITVLIVLILAYIGYKYIYIKPQAIVQLPNAIGTSQANITTVKAINPCTILAEQKIKIDNLQGLVKQAYNNLNSALVAAYNSGVSLSLTDQKKYTDAIILASNNYNNEAKAYNEIITLNKCTESEIQFNNFSEEKTLLSANSAKIKANSIDCNSDIYKKKLSFLKNQMNKLNTDYTIAQYNLSNYDVAENRQAVDRLFTQLENVKREHLAYYKLCNK